MSEKTTLVDMIEKMKQLTDQEEKLFSEKMKLFKKILSMKVHIGVMYHVCLCFTNGEREVQTYIHPDNPPKEYFREILQHAANTREFFEKYLKKHGFVRLFSLASEHYALNLRYSNEFSEEDGNYLQFVEDNNTFVI